MTKVSIKQTNKDITGHFDMFYVIIYGHFVFAHVVAFALCYVHFSLQLSPQKMEYMFTVPDEEYDNAECSDFDYDIFEDESVIKKQSQCYKELVEELERYKKFESQMKK